MYMENRNNGEAFSSVDQKEWNEKKKEEMKLKETASEK